MLSFFERRTDLFHVGSPALGLEDFWLGGFGVCGFRVLISGIQLQVVFTALNPTVYG